MLQAWHGRSDPVAKAALSDRLSFRRFLGMGLDEPTPDYSTLWRFREELAKRGLGQALLTAVNEQLDRVADARLCPPACDRLVCEPDRQAAPPAQAGVMRAPVHGHVLSLGTAVAGALLQLERQWKGPGIRERRPSYAALVQQAA